MDATQLTLLFSSRSQASTRLTLPLGDDVVGSDGAFASMLQQKEQSEQQQRQLDLERQNWRNQPSSNPPASQTQTQTQAQAPATSTSATTDTSKSQPVSKGSQQSHARDTSSTGTSASDASSSPQAASTADKSSTKSAGKADKADGTSGKDADHASEDQAASASGNLTTNGKQDPHHPGQTADGNGTPGDGGKNQGQNSQDGASQQGGNQTADDGNAATATVEGIESTVLASLLTGQVPVKGSPATSAAGGAATATGTANLTAGTKPAAGAANGQVAAATPGTAETTTAAGVAGLAPTLSIPGPGTTSTTAAAGPSDSTASIALPQAAGLLTQQNRAAPTSDLDANFANLIAKKTAPASTGSDNLHVTASKTGADNGPQIPRPLVRIDDSKTPQASIQPASTLTQAETSSAAGSDTALTTPTDQDDYGLDGLRGFSTLPGSLPAAGLIAAGKQADMMTTLRQQLANASLQDQVAIHMQRAASNNVDKISIDLSPAELGRIHVKMTVDDDKQVSATITVERPATLDLLQRDTKTLERALQDAGLKTDSGSLSFSLQRGNQGDSSDTSGWGQNGGRQIGSSGQEKAAAVTEISSASANNAVDTANGLVDVAV